jgi:hypothetical protein
VDVTGAATNVTRGPWDLLPPGPPRPRRRAARPDVPPPGWRRRAARDLHDLEGVEDVRLAGEAATPGYTTGPDGSGSGDTAGPDTAAGALGLLDQAVVAVQMRPIDELTDAQLVDELTRLEMVARRLDARAARVTAAVGDRQAARARQATAGGDERAKARAAERARQQAERDLAARHNKNPGEVRSAGRRGRQEGASPEARRAYDAGELPARQASRLHETLDLITDPATRARAERQLLHAARTQNPKEFGRTCRELLARVDHDAAGRAEDRRHDRRNAKSWTDPDGTVVFNGQWGIVDGSFINAAVNAFRRHDAPGEQRTSGQRLADAMTDMAKAALRAGEAPTQHGVRPHVQIHLDYDTLLRGAGVGYVVNGANHEPVAYAHIRRLLADAGVSRLLIDVAGVPVEAGAEVRTVPVGVFRGLIARDGGCIGDGCDVAPQFCEVMHLATPYRLKGRLTLDTAGFGCSFHHDKLDRHGWSVTWVAGRPVVHHPARPPGSATTTPTPTPTRTTTPSPTPDRQHASATPRTPVTDPPTGAKGTGPTEGRAERSRTDEVRTDRGRTDRGRTDHARTDRGRSSEPAPGRPEQISLEGVPAARGP